MLTTPSHAGITYYSWAGDQQNLRARTPLRPLGHGSRLLVDAPDAVWALTTPAMTAVIDARINSSERASDDTSVASIVERLDRQHSATATILEASSGFDPDVRAIGWGYRRSGDRWVVDVAFAYSSSATARDGERRLRERLDRPDARTGRVLRETLQPRDIDTAGALVVGSFTSNDADVTLDESVGSRGAMASLMPITLVPAGPPTSG